LQSIGIGVDPPMGDLLFHVVAADRWVVEAEGIMDEDSVSLYSTGFDAAQLTLLKGPSRGYSNTEAIDIKSS
jgi:hypothetical protein